MGKGNRQRGTMKIGHTKLPGQMADTGEHSFRNHAGYNGAQRQMGSVATGDQWNYKAPPLPDLRQLPTHYSGSKAPNDLNKQPSGHSRGTSPPSG
jgi:hypothetical protein